MLNCRSDCKKIGAQAGDKLDVSNTVDNLKKYQVWSGWLAKQLIASVTV